MPYKIIVQDMESALEEARKIMGTRIWHGDNRLAAYCEIVLMLEERGVTFPEDVLAWATGGEKSDRMLFVVGPPPPELVLRAMFLARDRVAKEEGHR